MISAQTSCKVMENMQDQKGLIFSAEKCELLRINPKPSGLNVKTRLKWWGLPAIWELILILVETIPHSAKNVAQEQKAQKRN